MSESDEHRMLVLKMVEHIQIEYPLIRLEKDIQARPGDSIPPVINGHRPDV